MRVQWFILLVVCLRTFPVLHAQGSGQRYASLQVANDYFYLPLQTDKYFTSGITLTWGRRHLLPEAMTHTDTDTHRYWVVNQELFTPKDIFSNQRVIGDRPFASYLTLGRGSEQPLAGVPWQLYREWRAGILGKHSQGGRLQNSFHGMVDFADQIAGWKYEVKSDLVLNYTIGVRRQIRPGARVALLLDSRVRAGTLYTDARQVLGFLLRPLKLGASGWVEWRTTADVRLVGYNATLSGGLLHRDERYRGVVIPARAVGSAETRLTVRYRGYGLSSGVRWLGPEFRGGGTHVWAWLGLTVR